MADEKKEQVEYYSDPKCKYCYGRGYFKLLRTTKPAVNGKGEEIKVSIDVDDKVSCKCLKVVHREIKEKVEDVHTTPVSEELPKA